MKTRFVLIAGAVCALSFLLFPQVSAARSTETVAARYRCPMHPGVVQDGEGSCPICGMKLVQVAPPAKSTPSAIAVAPDKQGILGITVGTVERAAASRALRVPGRVVPDEARVYRLNAGVEGSIRDVSPVTTGSRVRKDQVLASFYAPSALTMIQMYILNLGGKDKAAQQIKEGGTGEPALLINANLQQRFIQLENIGVSALQREEIAKARTIPDTIKIVSPASGFVLARNVAPGLKFERGFEFYRVADLGRVWVVSDVFPQDAAHVRVGMRAQVSSPEQHVSLRGTVTQVLPQFDATSRTLKIRVEVDNPGFVLRPDMFVDVQLSAALPQALTVPADAVVDTGLTRTVFVETAPGIFEPRRVETGFRNGDRIEIVDGLSAGQRIATSGAFFLDSETRMRSPAPGAAASPTGAPAPTGHEHGSNGGAGTTTHKQAQEAAHTSAVGLR